MENGNFVKLLKQVREEIKHTEAVDEKGAGLLRSLDNDIHELLAKSVGDPDLIPKTDFQRVEEAFYHFEATHPKLTALLSRLLESLSNSGI